MIATDKHYLVLEPGLEYEFMLEDLELAMTKEQLHRVTTKWNSGQEIENIAVSERRHAVEILIAIVHQSRKRETKIKRPLGYRGELRKSSLLVPGREQLK
ncbi:hypothetical protein [Virgibacillus sp. CBA3643]|uniref:hypothetical protein n=1 Tax=Virgibacillus sp. CBA3643 TaxID=2942278 RepID=UPI0035A2E0E3